MSATKRHRDTSEVIGWARRAIKAAGNCVSLRGLETGDDLGELAELSRALDDAMVVAIRGVLDHGHTWQEVADSLGVTRQTAHARYAPRVGERAVTRVTQGVA